jgi:H+/Cl- antiporter ClcA
VFRRRQPLPDDAVVLPQDWPAGAAEARLGDFAVPRSLVPLTLGAVVVGAVVAGVALLLLDLIAIVTHAAYTGTLSTRIAQPDPSVLGLASVAVPVVGGLVVGLMARFGSERIRGHGIPEAMETILLRGSRMEPRIAVLKPVSSAISIGTGGPFGAEGPIIVTGGAVGSLLGQLLHLTASERRVLLVAGAAGGMTAVFGTPVAAVLLAVELLLFEFRPRSMVPVGVAAVTAEAVRELFVSAGLLRGAPLFPVPPHPPLPTSLLLGAAAIGVVAGLLAWVMTRCVYAAEDAFTRLPLHWTWWPAVGGLVVGLGGLVEPRVLGVGYDTIGDSLAGRLAVGTLAAVLVGKLVVWSIALGSNTSGGILAPLLMMGAAAGGLAGHLLPGAGPATYALLGMAATLAGVTRSPFTSIVFGVELTHDVGVLPALLAACTIAHLGSVLLLRRSILTEKVARRGYHVSREYAVDAMQALFARDVMETDVVTVSPDTTMGELYAQLPEGSAERRQRLYPVVAADRLLGVLPWSAVLAGQAHPATPVGAAVRAQVTVLHPDETLRAASDLMVATGHGVLPVVASDAPDRLLGLVTQFHLLHANERVLVEERHRERPLVDRRVVSPVLTGRAPVALDGWDRP